jgi:hypothetical protein
MRGHGDTCSNSRRRLRRYGPLPHSMCIGAIGRHPISYVGDPSPAVYAATVEILGAALEPPPNEPDLERLLVNSAQIRTAVRLLRSGEQGGMQHD